MRYPYRRTALTTATTGVVVASLLGVTSSAFAAPAPAPSNSRPAAPGARAAALSAPVTGTWKDTRTGATGAIQGTFTPRHFDVRQGRLLASGTLVATVTDAAGKTIRTVNAPVSLPVQTTAGTASSSTADRAATTTQGTQSAAAAAAQCNVLNLLLGPLNLNLLGLVVTLNQVNLNIIAVPGAGALLGNLLCAVAGLLDGAGALTQIAGLLNQILGILNGLGATTPAAGPAAVPAL